MENVRPGRNPSRRGRGGLAGRPLQGDDVATSWRVIEGFSVGLVIPDLWQQEAVRHCNSEKNGARAASRDIPARCTHSRNHLNPEALFIHHKRLMMHESCSLKFELSAIAQIGRRPWRGGLASRRELTKSQRWQPALPRFAPLSRLQAGDTANIFQE